MEYAEEVQLLEDERVAKERTSEAFLPEHHTDRMVTLIYNRLHTLQAVMARVRDSSATKTVERGGGGAGGAGSGKGPNEQARADNNSSIVAKCRVPPRIATQPWLYYEDNTVLGVDYDDVARVADRRELLDAMTNSTYDPADCTAAVGAGSAVVHRLVLVFYYVRWLPDVAGVVTKVKNLGAYLFVPVVGAVRLFWWRGVALRGVA